MMIPLALIKNLVSGFCLVGPAGGSSSINGQSLSPYYGIGAPKFPHCAKFARGGKPGHKPEIELPAVNDRGEYEKDALYE